MHRLDPWKRALITALLLMTSGALVATSAMAREVAPRPIEAGEWYFGATAGFEEFEGPDFKAIGIYKNDSAAPGAPITLNNRKGWLIEERLDSRSFVPNVHFGYGFDRGSDTFLIRVEANLEGWNRKEGYSQNRLTPPLPGDGFQIDGADVGGAGHLIPIDGKDNDDDTEASYFFTDVISIEDISIDLEEYSRGGDIALYFDDRLGQLVYSRGVSFVYNYTFQKVGLEYFMPALLGATGIATEEDYRFEFKYKTRSHTVGSRLNYSVGWELLPNLSVFTTGEVGLFAKYSTLKGKQKAPCLTTCDLVGGDFTPGRRKLDIDDWKFAYDARMGAGVSVRLFVLRLTAHGGGTRKGGWTSPRETASDGTDLGKSGGWGYFANANATLIF